MRESALGRRSVGTVLAAGRVPATLLLFGLGTLAAVPTATIESAEVGPQQEAQPLQRDITGRRSERQDPRDGRGEGRDKPLGSVQV